MSRRNAKLCPLLVRAHPLTRRARRRPLTRSQYSSPSKLWDEVSRACPLWRRLSLERHTLPLQNRCRSPGRRKLRNASLYAAGRSRDDDRVHARRLQELCTSASPSRTFLVMYYAYVVCCCSGFHCAHTVRFPIPPLLDPLVLTNNNNNKSDQCSRRNKHVNNRPNAVGTQHCGDRRCSGRPRSGSLHRPRSVPLLETETETKTTA